MPLALALLLFWAFGAIPSLAQWSDVAPGIAYRDYTLDGPVRVFVARADRQVNTWTIDSMTSRGEIKGGHETVPNMAARYDDSITSDGRRYDVKVAINGDYYNLRSGYATSGQILSGWFVKRFTEYSGSSGFVWTTDRRCFLGGNVQNGPALQRVTFADGARLKIAQLNQPRQPDSLALYTHHFAAHTGTAHDGVEVLVRPSAPLGVAALPGVLGRIVRVATNRGSTPLPFNHVVLSAHGTAAAELLRHARAGETLHVALEIKDHGHEASRLPPADWRHAHASVGGPKIILVDGHVPRDWEAKAAHLASEGKRHGSVIRDPRTAVAFNDRYVFMVVIDGRSPASRGMTFTEAGFFCKDQLQATHAILQDGGGSSTLWVDGHVKNTPSGKGQDEKHGVLRAVANGYFIAEVLPPKKSAAFQPGQRVRFKAAGELRLGPGTTFGQVGQVRRTDTGTVLDEPLNGIFAKGTYWWWCGFGEMEGWAAQEQLTAAE